MASGKASGAGGNFVRDLIKEHLAEGRYAGVVTRFPPEPNGYLHIGHAKAICLDFGMAKEFGGRCHLRMDDTNPVTEDTEYVESIKEDVRWLGFDWGEHFYYASSHFDRLYQFAERLVTAGLAYVDFQTVDEIRANRADPDNPSAPGTPSPQRDTPPDENLAHLQKMRAGGYREGECVLRAKIDMAHPNILMRDPLMYRIRHERHHRTGEQWCIYPMYDFAHGISDAVEGVTHSLCTLEFENNRDLYDWFVDAVGFTAPRTRQYEFARLALTYTITSKRKLRQLVEEGHVSGWDDPRMPTLAGIRRRGVPAEAIVDFCEQLGVSKANSVVDVARLEHVIRDHLNRTAPRVMAVLDPLKVIVDNYPDGQTEQLDVPYFPEQPDGPRRQVPFSKELYIEREDFMEAPSKKFYRLAPGREVRLRWAYFLRCTGVEKDSSGHITAIRCTYDPATRGGSAPDDRKVKSTLHWVSAPHAHHAPVRLYDRLFRVEQPGAGDSDFLDELNPGSLRTITAMVEPSLQGAQPGERLQFERKGYFCVDTTDSGERTPVFNRTVTLKDAWARIQRREDAPQKAARKKPRQSQKKARAPLDVAAVRAEKSPALAEAFDRFQQALGLSPDDAHLLTENPERAALFEAAVAEHRSPVKIANLINNTLMATLKERPAGELPFGGAAIGALVRLLDEEAISSRIAKAVLDKMLDGEGGPDEIVAREGLRQLSRPEELAPILDQVFADNPDSVAALKAGERKHQGFLIGEIMKASGGRANPRVLGRLIQQRVQQG